MCFRERWIRNISGVPQWVVVTIPIDPFRENLEPRRPDPATVNAVYLPFRLVFPTMSVTLKTFSIRVAGEPDRRLTSVTLNDLDEVFEA
jgi:hypothetical protein